MIAFVKTSLDAWNSRQVRFGLDTEIWHVQTAGACYISAFKIIKVQMKWCANLM